MKYNYRSTRIAELGALIVFFILVTGGVHAVRAQSEAGNAAIEGTVVDGNGAAIGGATISVRGVDTGLERAAVTSANGRYSAPVLPVGNYVVKVAATGFGPAERTAISLRVGETTTVDFNLKPASVTEKVTVTPDPEVIDKDESATGSTITPRSVQDLPARGRNFSEYVLLTPAVMQESDRGTAVAGQRSIN